MTFGQSEGYRMKHTSCEQFDKETSPRRFFFGSCCFFKKSFFKVKATNQQLSFNIFL